MDLATEAVPLAKGQGPRVKNQVIFKGQESRVKDQVALAKGAVRKVLEWGQILLRKLP